MESFVRTLTLFGLFSVLGIGLYWVKEYRDKTNHLNTIIATLVDCNNDMKNTLLSGLVSRFSSEESADNEDEITMDFERFIAKIFRMHYGGKTSITRANGDYGVSIEHRRDEELHLGRVICCAQEKQIGFEPIATIHSQMVKQNASSGFVVTTSDFTSNAKKYAKDLEIELVNGSKLVDLWTSSLRSQKLRNRVPEKKQA